MTTCGELTRYISDLEQSRARRIVFFIHTAIRDAGRRKTSHDELSAGALARRLYAYSLRIGGDPIFEVEDEKGEEVPAKNSRLPSPRWKEVAKALNHFAQTQVSNVFDELSVKDIEHFSTFKVRGSNRRGFYLLVALFLLEREEQGEFEGKDKIYAALIPASEARLGETTANFVARACNQEAERLGEPTPFAIKPSRPQSPNPEVAFRFVFDPKFENQSRELLHKYRSPVDGNAHFVLYRCRKSKPAEIMQSFLVLKPFQRSTREDRLRFHRTLHIYKAPRETGGAYRGAPGQIVPLDSGLYILGAQHADKMRAKDEEARREDKPFRNIELIYFPWETLDTSHLYSGLMFASNNKGEPLVCRVCARPTAVAAAHELDLEPIKIHELRAKLEMDGAKERAFVEAVDPELRAGLDADNFFEVYDQFGGIPGLANAIVDGCNNDPPEWDIIPGFSGADNVPLERALARGWMEDPSQRWKDVEGVAFDFWNHLRFAPLVSG